MRSDEEAKHVREAHKGVNEEELEVVIVPDIATKGAFDEVAKTPGLEAVLHTASPFHYKFSMFPFSLPLGAGVIRAQTLELWAKGDIG